MSINIGISISRQNRHIQANHSSGVAALVAGVVAGVVVAALVAALVAGLVAGVVAGVVVEVETVRWHFEASA